MFRRPSGRWLMRTHIEELENRFGVPARRGHARSRGAARTSSRHCGGQWRCRDRSLHGPDGSGSSAADLVVAADDGICSPLRSQLFPSAAAATTALAGGGASAHLGVEALGSSHDAEQPRTCDRRTVSRSCPATGGAGFGVQPASAQTPIPAAAARVAIIGPRTTAAIAAEAATRFIRVGAGGSARRRTRSTRSTSVAATGAVP